VVTQDKAGPKKYSLGTWGGITFAGQMSLLSPKHQQQSTGEYIEVMQFF